MTPVAAAATSTLDAAIVAASNTPISAPASAGTNFWDVDGGGVNEFLLINDAAFGDLKGSPGSLVGTTFSLWPLLTSYSVGPAAEFTGYVYSVTYDGYASSARKDETNFGFRFLIGGETHYGRGKIDVGNDGANPGHNWAITEAYYEMVPRTAIHVGSVPEPSGQALLACGAAGVLARRKRQEA